MRFIYALLFGFSYLLYSQPELNFPLKLPVSLAGNFGELRATHFHMGLDFKTDGAENVPVYAAEVGYVSRIAISPRGYGKVLYIDHPKYGITSVYAHLNSFSPRIQRFCDSMQSLFQTNTIDFKLGKELPITRDEQVAWSGNTGGSEGPHLHFEVRDLITEKTLNPLMFFDIKDDAEPVIASLILYKMTPFGAEFLKQVDVAEIQNKTIVIDEPNVGIAIEGYDLGTNSSNQLGLYKVDLYEKNDWIYSCLFDTLDFENQSLVKIVDDPLLHKNKGGIYKLFDEKCVSNHSKNRTNGHLFFKLEETKNIVVEIYDIKGNRNFLNFKIRFSHPSPALNEERKNVLTCENKNELHLKKMGVKFDFPLNCFPYMVEMIIDKEFKSKKNDVSPRFKIGNEYIPVLKPYTIYFDKIDVPNALLDKVYLENVVENKNKNYKLEFTHNGYRAQKVASLGEMALVLDVDPPFVTSNNLANHEAKSNFVFKVDDALSGVRKYQLIVDKEWKKIYYDEKNKTLIYNPINTGKEKKHKAVLEIEDLVGNKNSISYELFY